MLPTGQGVKLINLLSSKGTRTLDNNLNQQHNRLHLEVQTQVIVISIKTHLLCFHRQNAWPPGGSLYSYLKRTWQSKAFAQGMTLLLYCSLFVSLSIYFVWKFLNVAKWIIFIYSTEIGVNATLLFLEGKLWDGVCSLRFSQYLMLLTIFLIRAKGY